MWSMVGGSSSWPRWGVSVWLEGRCVGLILVLPPLFCSCPAIADHSLGLKQWFQSSSRSAVAGEDEKDILQKTTVLTEICSDSCVLCLKCLPAQLLLDTGFIRFVLCSFWRVRISIGEALRDASRLWTFPSTVSAFGNCFRKDSLCKPGRVSKLDPFWAGTLSGLLLVTSLLVNR